MDTKRGEPENLHLRQLYLESSQFASKDRAHEIHKLLTEPDPILVADPRTKRLMSERDVVGLANLSVFMETAGAPEDQSYSQAEIGAAAHQLEQTFGGTDGSRELPVFYALGAELWAGIRREWATLDDGERQIVRDYVREGSAKPMTLDLYGRLLGVAPEVAEYYSAHDQRQRQLAELRRDLAIYSRAMGQAIIDKTVL